MMFRGKVRTIHFVGIGGIGMSGIAEVLLNIGFAVTGSDLREGESVQRLRDMGAVVHIGHRPENIGSADVLVRSTAVTEANIEVAEAHRRLIPVIRRAEMLAELMRLKHGIAIAGTHGKTTTTSMLAAVLGAGGLDPTVVIGGRLDQFGGSNARLGEGEYLVAEADESDGSFLLLSPTVGLVTNIDPEHLDHYGDAETLERTFVEFVNKVPFYGFAVLCIDHPTVQRLIPEVRRRVVTYGLSRQADYRAAALERDGLNTTFTMYRREERLGTVTLGMPGVHNVSNAVGAIATAMELSIPFATVSSALDGFTGVQRRFTVRANVNNVLIIDDYGHHPVEIEATLEAAEQGFAGRRVIAVVQPHRFSRVRDLWDDFCGAFNQAAVVVVCPIYAAGETPLDGVDHHALGDGIRDRGHRGVHVSDSLEDATDWLAEHTKTGDVVVTLGAGNVNQICGALAARLGAGA